MKSRSGFTLIEVLIVIVVIAILASIITLAFNVQQRESRDSKRATDILVLSEEFERYYAEKGNYPYSCNLATQSTEYPSHFSVMYCMSDRYNGIYYGHETPVDLWRGTSVSVLRETFTNVSENFGDPRAPAGQNPINAATTNFGVIPHTSYLVFSPDLAPNSATHLAGHIRFSTREGSQITCRYTMTPNIKGNPDTRPHQYIMGYYSEAADAWRFYRSNPRADVNPLQWTTLSGPANLCEPADISTLKNR